MKKVLFPIVLACMLFLCGCANNETIVGAWIAKDGGSLVGIGIDQPTSYDVYYVFNEDGTGKMLNVFPDGYNEYQQNVDFTYTVDENNTITMTIDARPSKGTYKIDGDTLTLDTQRTESFSMRRVSTEDVPSLPDAPFNLICGTETINEYSGKIGEQVILEADHIPAGMTVEWQTDNAEVVAIEPSRLGTQCIIYIEGAGNATVTATRGEETRTVKVIGIENTDS